MGRFTKKLSEITELPEATFGCCPQIIINSNSEVIVEECLEIMLYGEKEIRLRLHGLFAVISGSELSLSSFSCKSIRILGRIDGITLSKKSGGS